MKTRRNRRRYGGRRRSKSGKRWTTALDAAQRTLNKTGSVESARQSLRKQALMNAKKLFGSVTI